LFKWHPNDELVDKTEAVINKHLDESAVKKLKIASCFPVKTAMEHSVPRAAGDRTPSGVAGE